MRIVADGETERASVRRALFVFFSVACAAGLLACQQPSDELPGIDREQYVELYVKILRAAGEAPDTAAAAQRADSILRLDGLTRRDLTEFAERHAEDPRYLADVWTEIERRLREPPSEPDSPEEGGAGAARR